MTNTTNYPLATESQKMRRLAEQMLADEVKGLLNRDEQEGLKWKGTSIDLMEALHVAYSTGSLQNEEGICLSFNSIVNRACRLLHVGRPHNPYECAARGRRRKGMQMNSYLERYQRRMARHSNDKPLWNDIEQ